MLALNLKNILEKEDSFKKIGVKLPKFDCLEMINQTKENPVWLHFGAGNIFRGFIGEVAQSLLEQGEMHSGIIAGDTFDFDIIDKIYKPYDNLTMLVKLNPDGTTEKEVIASIAESLMVDSTNALEMTRLREIWVHKALQMVSFTITEKGYALRNMDGELFDFVKEDMENDPQCAKHAMGVVTTMLYERFMNGAYPIAMVSMDNCSHNGEKLKAAILDMAKAWITNGYMEKAFLSYLEDEEKVSFPWSMIDKITPRPAAEVEKMLKDIGIENMAPIVTSKNTFIAPFVNAEVPQYLVIEDRFPNGRPPLEKAGVYLTDRKTVNQTETMKVTTCLNPLHTALAVYGCLLGFTSIWEEMKDRQLKGLVEAIGYQEGMPVVVNPGIIDPKAFIKEVIEVRLPNPFIPDAPQRIATDTSQKVGIRFGETIKSYVDHDGLDAKDLTFIPLAIAGWCRYLLGIDDQGQEISISSDPMLVELQSHLKGIEYLNPLSYQGQLQPILSNKVLFGSDLFEVGLGEKIEQMFVEMISVKGAVRKILSKYIQ